MSNEIRITSISFKKKLYKEFKKWCINHDTNVRAQIRVLVKELLEKEALEK